MLKVSQTDVITRPRKFDSGAITALYEKNRLGVFRFLYYRVGDPQIAEDLTSEVFLRMITALEKYQPQSASFEAWLYQIARNLAIDHYRKASVRNHVPLEDNLTVETQDVDKTVDRNLTHELLRRALAKLNEIQRDVVVLRFVNGLSIAVVAQTLHKSEDSIKSLQRRALIELREILNEWEVHYV